MRQFFVLISLLIFAHIIHAQTISGVVFDKETLEGLPFANAILLQNDKQIAGTTTDIDGNYSFKNVKNGIYDIEFVYIGYPNQKITDIKINDVKMEVNVEMKEDLSSTCYYPILRVYAIPLIDMRNTSTGQTLHASDIKRRF